MIDGLITDEATAQALLAIDPEPRAASVQGT
jgi:hypothetical protein